MAQGLRLRVSKDRGRLTLSKDGIRIVLEREELLRVIEKTLCGGIIVDDKSLTLIAECCM